ncbi:DUF4136 domain-containing protein [Paucibacter sp. AS339]|uniref:DUF4136 domain-containing protein n=1 Tax=Paucibacter hankyongi TaxID=3133434 RepID=UPI0030ACA9C5
MNKRGRMNRPLAGLVLAGAALLVGGCASGPQVRVSMDKAAVFSQYQTFAYASPLGTDRGGYQSIVSQHLKDATTQELQARGMRLVETSPQLLVNFSASLNEKMRVSATPAPMLGMGYYGYRAGMYTAWPLYGEQQTLTQYTEGTLNIDVVDAARKQLIWEGVVTDSVTQKELDQLKASIDKAVKAAFAKYPVALPAASAAPSVPAAPKAQ